MRDPISRSFQGSGFGLGSRVEGAILMLHGPCGVEGRELGKVLEYVNCSSLMWWAVDFSPPYIIQAPI